MTIASWFVAAAAALLVTQQPTRDAPAPPRGPTGTASVSGTVVSADARALPIAGTLVTLAGAALPISRSAVTDERGRFEISGLPPGRFGLSARKAAYLPGTYGAVRVGRPGVDLTLGDGQQLANLTIALTHGAAVGGLVRTGSGEPLPNAAVSVMRIGPSGSGPASSATTDDRGRYRVFGLAPGQYVISATHTALLTTTAGMMSTAEVDATLAALRSGKAAGNLTPAVAALPPVRTVNVAPVFYPGVLSATDAVPVTLVAGEDLDDIDVAIQLGRAATISGTVVFPAAPTANVSLWLNLKGPDLPIAMGGSASEVRPAADGAFRFPSVNPGSYVIRARTWTPQIDRVAGGADSPILWGRADVAVNGDDMEGINVVLQPTKHLTGRVEFAGASALAADVTHMRVSIKPASEETMRRMTAYGIVVGSTLQMSAPIRPDGTFDLDGVAPGALTIDVAPLPTGWSLRSVMVSGRDVLDVPLEVPDDAEPLGDAVITLTNRPASLDGAIQAPADHAASDYFIVVFPADQTLRRSGSRRVRTTRASTNGRYTVSGLPPGTYLVAALGDLEPDDLLDPAFFEGLAPSAVTITIGEGEQKTQNLRVRR